jgi:hypothetical protein
MTTTEHICPHCGKPVPTTALQGICPECMLKAGVPTEGGDSGAGGATTAKPPPPTPAEIAKFFPQLEILECLGRGGMGVVYKARQPRLDRLVALKVLAPEREKDPQFAERFAREAKALARLNHPNIVTVHDFGEADGLFYLMMEYVDGLSLRELLRTRKLAPQEALAIVPKICEALQFAHNKGVVHRDIKPENVLVDTSGQVKIADFGIAKIVGGTAFGVPAAGGAAEAEPVQPAVEQQTNITGEQILGTPNYMAPEQVAHPQSVDHRADIYSLGVVFYEMLTGELPLGKFAPPSRKVQVDVRLDEIVLHALEKEPERRYQHASEVKSDVETIAADASKPNVRSPKSEAEARLEFLERRRRALLLYGFWASVIGLPVTLALRMPQLSMLTLPGIVIGGFKLGLFKRGGWHRLFPWLGKAGLGRTVMAEDTAARWAQLVAFGAALLLLVLGFWKLTTFELKPVELFFGVLLVLILSLLMVLLGYAIRPVAGTSGHGAADPARKAAARRRTLWTALGAALIVIALRVFVIGPYHAVTDSVSPDVPQGSYAMVFKLARSFAPGDIVVFRGDGKRLLGRVAGAGPAEGVLQIARRGESPRRIPVSDVVGRVILNTRVGAEGRPDFAVTGLVSDATTGKSIAFGPVLERVLLDPDSWGGRSNHETLRLRAGELSSVLDGVAKESGGRLRALTASDGDLFAEYDDYVGKRWALVTAGLKLCDLAPRQWETATVAEVQQALETPLVIPHVEHYGAILYLLPEGLSPMTFGFRTRQGDCGLLQITGFTDNPRSVKLRYKLVTAAESDAGASQPRTEPSGGPVSRARPGEYRVTLTNGVTLEVVAIARNPRGTNFWWQPDGTPLATPPVKVVELPKLKFTTQSKITIIQQNEFLVYVRRELPPGMVLESFASTFTPRPSDTEFPPTVQEINSKQRTSAQLVCFADPPDAADYQETVACGPWEAVSVYGVGTKTTRDLERGVMALWSEPRYERGALRFDVMHNANRGQYALRMLARLRTGGSEKLVFHSGVLSGSPAKGFALIHGSEQETKNWLQQVKELVIERTPWVSGEIRAIALQPKAASAPATSAPPAANREVLELRLN